MTHTIKSVRSEADHRIRTEDNESKPMTAAPLMRQKQLAALQRTGSLMPAYDERLIGSSSHLMCWVKAGIERSGPSRLQQQRTGILNELGATETLILNTVFFSFNAVFCSAS